MEKTYQGAVGELDKVPFSTPSLKSTMRWLGPTEQKGYRGALVAARTHVREASQERAKSGSVSKGHHLSLRRT